MKGYIEHYVPDRGFGFIIDENFEKRFFHISDVREKEKFLHNIEDYYYTDYIDRICYVVEFAPSVGKKGLTAESIELTAQILNEKIPGIVFNAIIDKIHYETASLTRISSGYKKGQSAPLGATAGGNGTYRLGYPEVLRELLINYRRIDTFGFGEIDIRDLALHLNKRVKITDSFVNALNNKLAGQPLKFPSNQMIGL